MKGQALSVNLVSVRKEQLGEITPTRVAGGTINRDQAARAVDRDVTTAMTTDDWFKLEFAGTFFIQKVVIYYVFYTNWSTNHWCAQSITNFKQCVDKDNNVDVSVYQGEVKQKSCGTLQLTYGLEQSDQIYTLICNTEGDTVKLSMTTGNIVVFEIAVTGTGS